MRVLILVFAAAFFHAATAAADHKHVGSSDGVITGEEVLTGVISEIERRIIGRYYENGHYQGGEQELAKGKGKKKNGKNKGLPPGLAKRDHLPPGLQKHLDRRGTLPPGLAKRDLPPDLRGTDDGWARPTMLVAAFRRGDVLYKVEARGGDVDARKMVAIEAAAAIWESQGEQ